MWARIGSFQQGSIVSDSVIRYGQNASQMDGYPVQSRQSPSTAAWFILSVVVVSCVPSLGQYRVMVSM